VGLTAGCYSAWACGNDQVEVSSRVITVWAGGFCGAMILAVAEGYSCPWTSWYLRRIQHSYRFCGSSVIETGNAWHVGPPGRTQLELASGSCVSMPVARAHPRARHDSAGRFTADRSAAAGTDTVEGMPWVMLVLS
jgi:hypothetical protein